MGRPPVIPAERMTRIVLSVLAGEMTIAETARRVEGVRGVKNVRIHPLGSDVRVDLEINIDGDLTVSRGHTIAHAVEDAVRGCGDDH